MDISKKQDGQLRLSDGQVRQVLLMHQDTGQPLADILVGLGFCTEGQSLQFIADRASVPLVQIRERDLSPEAIALIPP
ncbi:MAG TPA: hypothetical protein DCL60_10705, partial [Armatimonadetes bacterium]|nr:hypothetical protein [Armatimonadota bacterium]